MTYDGVQLFCRIVDAVIMSDQEAKELQGIIERMCHQKLDFDLRSGDIVLGQFANLPEVGKAQKKSGLSRKSGQSVGHSIVSSISKLDQLKNLGFETYTKCSQIHFQLNYDLPISQDSRSACNFLVLLFLD